MNKEEMVFSQQVITEAKLEEACRERDDVKQLLLKVCQTFPRERDIEVYGGQELIEWYNKNSQ